MVQESVSLKLGEKRRLRVLVENTNGLDCHISSATFKLVCGQEIEAAGECEIEVIDVATSVLGILVTPQRPKTTYQLVVEYVIGDETYIYTCQVRVCGRCSHVP